MDSLKVVVAACLAATATTINVAQAQHYNQAIVLGDSTVDSGWFRVAPSGNPLRDARVASAVANGGTGAPVGVGLMSSQWLAAYFGLAADPANRNGTNYAISGGFAADTPNGAGNSLPGPNLPSATGQIANYLAANGGRANPNALYVVSAGVNDVQFALDNFGTVAQREGYLRSRFGTFAAQVRALQDAGARYILVPNIYSTRSLDPFARSEQYAALVAAGVKFIPADHFNLVRFVQANPTMFGFTPATVNRGTVGPGTGSACVTPVGANPMISGWGGFCANSTTPSANHAYLRSADSQQTSFWSDNQHFSNAGQKILADYNYGILVAPSQISFLAEAPLKTRAAVISTVFNQVAVSQSQSGMFNGWASGDVQSLKMDNWPGFPNDPGTPVAASAGFDYRLTREWLVGVAFSIGTTKQTLGFNGDYRQNEFAGSVYAAYRDRAWWATAVAAGGVLDYDVNRVVPLGVTQQSNRGSANGTNFSFAAEVGYDFVSTLGAAPVAMPTKAAPALAYGLRHGPVAGIVLQRVHVDGFTETDAFASTGGLTALSFESQTRNSAVTALGYQVSLRAGMWEPFAKAVWNHELVDTDRLVTASLTTIAAPSFSLPAVELGRDWGTATVGTRFNINERVAGYAAFVGQLGQDRVTNFGGQFGLNVAFGPVVSTLR